MLERFGIVDAIHGSVMFRGYGLYGGKQFFAILDGIPKIHPNSLTDYSSQHAAVFAAFTEKTLNKCCEVTVDILEDTVHLNV